MSRLPPGWDVFDSNEPPTQHPDDPGPEPPADEAPRADILYRASRPGDALRCSIEEMPRLGLYHRGGSLCRVLPQPSGHPQAVSLSEAGLRCLLSDHIRYYSRRKKKDGDYTEIEVAPPMPVVAALYREGYWPGVPHLRAITQHPVPAEDGSVRAEPGYDDTTEVLSVHSERIRVSPPSQGWAISSRNRLLDIVDEFPWASTVDADVWLAAVLTPLVRPWCGPAPMIVITSSTPAAGKDLLAKTAAAIVCGGRGVGAMAWTSDQEEWRKAVLALGLMGPEIIIMDNVPSGTSIGGAVLDMSLTRDTISGRILGSTRMVEVELLATWIATGNNLGTTGDTARRALISRIEPMCERPEDRDGWRIPDLLRHVDSHRGELLGHALSIVAGYLSLGCPDAPRPLGSYQGWSRVVRGAIMWAGGEDVADALASRVDRCDDDAELHRALLAAWEYALPHGATASQALIRCSEHEDDLGHLPEVMAALCPGRVGGYGSPRQLSRRLRALEDRVRAVDGRTLMLSRVNDRSPTTWQVVEVEGEL